MVYSLYRPKFGENTSSSRCPVGEIFHLGKIINCFKRSVGCKGDAILMVSVTTNKPTEPYRLDHCSALVNVSRSFNLRSSLVNSSSCSDFKSLEKISRQLRTISSERLIHTLFAIQLSRHNASICIKSSVKLSSRA